MTQYFAFCLAFFQRCSFNIVFSVVSGISIKKINFSKIYLEHNLFKNMSKDPGFSRRTQIQTPDDDARRIKKKDFLLIEYSLQFDISKFAK